MMICGAERAAVMPASARGSVSARVGAQRASVRVAAARKPLHHHAISPASQPIRRTGAAPKQPRVLEERTKGRQGLHVAHSASAAAAPVSDEPPAEGISELSAAANVAKAILGAGCFALPWAYAKSGTVFTTFYMTAAAVLCVYMLTFMQRARDVVVEADAANKELCTSYSGLAKATIGATGGRLVQATVLVCCFGICSAYMVFVAATMSTILAPPLLGTAMSQNTLVWYVTPILVMLSWIRNMAGVSIISMLGNISVLGGMIAVAAYALKLPPQFSAIPLVDVGGFAQAFGSVAFLFFVHFSMPGIQASMAKPQRFLPAATSGFVFSVIVSALFGAVGALYFGPNVNSVVIAMLQGQGIVIGVKLLLCLNLLCTFPVVVGSAFVILETLIKEATGKEVSGPVTYSMRTAFVVLAAVVAVGVPSFGKLLGLVGGVSCTLLTMVFPPLMMLAACNREKVAINPIERLLIYLVVAAGLGIGYLSIIG